MVQGEFEDAEGAEAIGFSHHDDLGFVVETLNGTAGELLASLEIIYRSQRDGQRQLRAITIATNKDELLDDSKGIQFPKDWSRDGRHLVLSTGSADRGDIVVIDMKDVKAIVPHTATDANEFDPRISPDGRWLAYASDATKRTEIYVGSFPTPGAKFQISTEGGSHPVWSRDGRELFYFAPDNKLMAVPVKSGIGTFSHEAPRPLFSANIPTTRQFDVTPDGRFLIPVLIGPAGASDSVTLVQNWTELLTK